MIASDRQSTAREWLLLPLLATIAALLLTAVYLGTQSRIADNRQAAADAIVLDALSLSADTQLTDKGDSDDRKLLTLSQPRKIYLAQRHGQLIALIVPVTARDGYNGAIELIVGIAPDGSVIGVRALSHRETAGLGDRIDADKSAWLKQFIGKNLGAAAEQWQLKSSGGDFDQITGATVTSRAVIDAVYRALQYFELHREQMLQSNAVETEQSGAHHE